jgi:arylsulfatase
MKSDPGQKQNVAGSNPEIVERMRAHYQQWWSSVAPGVNEFSAIHLGSDAENPVLLSPCDWQDVFLDQAAQVRRGEHKNGAWNVVVERDGEYQISLRRWPVEADAAISAGVPEYKAADGVYLAGVALPIRKARLKVAGYDESRPVSEADKEITFQVPLKAGRTQLQTWFSDAQGTEICGAYYVYVRRP